MVQTRSQQPSRDRGLRGINGIVRVRQRQSWGLLQIKSILIVERTQLIVNKCMQVCHCESYGMS